MPARIHRFPSVTSTQDVIRELAAEGEPVGTAVIADEQTAGRGRAGRGWSSRAGVGVYLSMLVKARGAQPTGLTSLAAGLAARDALTRVCRFRAERAPLLKWPNDVVAPDGRKLAGLLIEMESGPPPLVIVGLGLNFGQRANDFPPELRDVATSLRMECEELPDRGELERALLDSIDAWMERDDERIRRAWMSASILRPGDGVVIRDGDQVGEGVFDGIEGDGAIRLRRGSSSPVVVRVGDVSLRPARSAPGALE